MGQAAAAHRGRMGEGRAGRGRAVYPWGNDAPDSTLLNYNGNVGDTTEVGKYPKGARPTVSRKRMR